MSHQTAPSLGSSDQVAEPRSPAALALEQSNARKAVVAASIGNGLEWFDLIVYGTFAVTISKLFFPTTNETASLLLAFASFGVSFIMRPLGGIIIGRYADRAGRKAGMLVSILVMFVGTLLIVVAPTAAAIGVTASILVLVARLLQIATGGEFGTATAYLIEYAPSRKAFYGSWQVATQGGGILLAGIFGFVLNTYLSTQALDSWGWRLPFIFALAIGPVGWYIRSKMEETPEFLATERSTSPLRETFIGNGGRLLAIVGVVSLGSVGVYIALFMPTYAIVNLGMPKSVAFLSTLIFGVVMSIGSPFVGTLADKVACAGHDLGRRRNHRRGRPGVHAAHLGTRAAHDDRGRTCSLGAGHGLLRAAAGHHVLHVPGPHPLNGTVPGVQHRGHRLRRVCSVYPDVADRQHRVFAGAGVLPRHHCGHRGGQPHHFAEGVPPGLTWAELRRQDDDGGSCRRRRPDQVLGRDVRAQGRALQRRGHRPHHHRYRGQLGIPARGGTPRPAGQPDREQRC